MTARRVDGHAHDGHESLTPSMYPPVHARTFWPRRLPGAAFVFSLLLILSVGCSAQTPAAGSISSGGAGSAVTNDVVYVVNSDDDAISVIEAARNEVVTTIKVGKLPHNVVVAPDGKKAYVTNGESNDLSVIDTASNAVVATIPLGSPGASGPLYSKDPQGLAISPDGRYAYVANYDANELAVVDLQANKAIDAIEVGSSPQGVALSPTGDLVYVVNLRSNEVVEVDAAARKVTRRFPAGQGPAGIALTPDGKKLYVGGHGGMSGGMAKDGGGMSGTAGTAKEGGKMGSNHEARVIDAETGNIVTTVTCGVMPVAFAANQQGTFVYVVNHGSDEVQAIETSNNKVAGTFKVGKNPQAIALSSDGRLAFVANGDTNDVSVIDLLGNRVVSTIKVGKGPRSIAVLAR